MSTLVAPVAASTRSISVASWEAVVALDWLVL